MYSRLLKLTLVIAILMALAACTESRVSLGQAYVAPGVLHLHNDLSAKGSVVADLKHGDRLDIVDVQRRMVRVRTEGGKVGWVDSALLLSPEQMADLKNTEEQERSMPPEGTATAFETLNVHIDPDRQSPALEQIPEGGRVTVLAHKTAPKIQNAARTSNLVINRPQPLSRKQKKEQKIAAGSFRLPPRPPAPHPPANWLDLSAERIDVQSGEAPKPAAKPVEKPEEKKAKIESKPVVMDDWTLVRTSKNEVGWVLTRNLLMSIPDEVAQYAEGKTITAFFDLGTVPDEQKGAKHNWLWGTAARGLPYDFDAWRVFLWNNHKHRYETSFRQRDLEGYFPIRVDPADPSTPVRTFSVITKDDDEKMRVRSYTFDGHLVHLKGTEDYNAAAEAAKSTAAALDTKAIAAKSKSPNWIKRQWANLKHSIFGN